MTTISRSFVTCAFLSNRDIYHLLYRSIEVSKAAADIKEAILKNTNSPYAMDYYLPLKRHSFEKAAEPENESLIERGLLS